MNQSGNAVASPTYAALMSARVLSVNLGRGGATASRGRRVTGIDKQPVEAIEVRDPGPRDGGDGSGVVGDVIGNRRHHGGSSQAVYLVAEAELRHWSGELERELLPGAFGENVTTTGIDVDALVVGTRLRVGEEVELEVRLPREPCATFAAHMGVRGWVKRFAARGRTGAYCAVVVSGTIRAGDDVTPTDVPVHGIDVVEVFRAAMGDLDRARAVLDAGILPAPYDAEMASMVAARA